MTKEKFTNTLYTNDNLFILNGMNSNLVDLIYLDPPFNSKRFYSAPIGSKAAGSSFKDMWTWEDVNEAYLEILAGKYPALARFIGSIGKIHSKAMKAYLTYMAQRIIEMHRILKDTGSLYLHCDATASHYLKIVLDEIFGKNNFRNEIVWCYNRWTAVANKFQKMHDVILYYTKDEKHTFNKLFADASESRSEKLQRGYQTNTVKSGEERISQLIVYDREKAQHLIASNKYGNIVYKDNSTEVVLPDWWEIPILNSQSKERTGYPTQKPLALLKRIILASSNEGDIVFDPFCGCATTCVAAQQLNRKWIGIDIEKQAVNVLIERLSNDAGMFKDFINTAMIPQRTDVKYEPKSKSVKERLYKEQNGICNGCKNEYLIKDFEIDHIIPVNKGGGSYYENYQLLCGNCNKTKNNRPMEYLRIVTNSRDNLLKTEIEFGE